MKKLILTLIVASAALTTSPTNVSAADYPQVSNLKPFSAEANFMSLPGYMRYLVWEQNGVWMSRGEAVAAVQAEMGAAGR